MDSASVQPIGDMHRSSRRSIQPTKPIEIPTRRKPSSVVCSPYLSPIRDQLSPELIFEMSPLASDFPLSPNYPLCSSALQNAVEPEYLYPLPIFSPHNFASLQRRSSHTPPPASTVLQSPTKDTSDSVLNFPFDAWPKPPTTIPVSGAQNQNGGSPTIKGTPKHKITGFTPMYPSPVSDASVETRRRERLSPTPRCISPWNNHLDDPDALEASMCTSFDIDSFMIRRMNETRKSLLHCPSNVRLAHRY